RRVGRKRLRLREQMHRDFEAAQDEVAGEDEAVAAIVSLAATDENRAADTEGHKHIRGAASRILHEDERRNAVTLDGLAVQMADLRAGERTHGCSSSITG